MSELDQIFKRPTKKQLFWWSLCRPFYRFTHYLYLIKSFIKGKTFQLFRGFDYRDTWNLDYSLAKWILPRLKYFRKDLNSLPIKKDGKMTENGPEAMLPEEWGAILDKIIFAFEFILDDDKYIDMGAPKDFNWGFKQGDKDEIIFNDNRKINFKFWEEAHKKHKEGMKLFAEYYRDLWV